MGRPKWTARRLMIAVFALAVALGSGIPAYLSWRDDEGHIHTFIAEEPPRQFFDIESKRVYPSFWGRYRRYVLGRDLQTMGDCNARLGEIEEVCSWTHPEIMPESRGLWGWDPLRPTARQRKELDRLNRLIGTPLSDPGVGDRL